MSQNTPSRYIPGWMIALVVLALIGIITLFTLQQQASSNQAAALEAQALAERREATSLAEVAAANAAQAEAESIQATAVADAEIAATAQAEAESIQATAVADAEIAAAAQAEAESIQATAVADAEIAATGQAQAELGQATSIAAAYDLVTQQADAQATQAAQAEIIDANATAQSDMGSALAAVSTEVSIESDRADALATSVAALAVEVTASSQQLEAVSANAAVGLSRQLAAESRVQVGERFNLALLLAVEANAQADTPNARGSLYHALQSRQYIQRFIPNVGVSLYGVAYSPNGSIVAAGGSDNSIRLWDTQTGEQIGSTLIGHSSSVFTLAFRPDSAVLASAGADNTIIFWDLSTGAQIGTALTGHNDWVYALAFSPDGSTLASGSNDSTIILWDVETGNQRDILAASGGLRSLAYAPDGSTLASGTSTGSIELWNLAENAVGRTFSGHTVRVSGLEFSSDGKMLVSSSGDRTVKLWDVRTGESLYTLVHNVPVNDVTLRPAPGSDTGGGLLISASDVMRVWELGGGEPYELPIRPDHQSTVWSAAFSPNGGQYATVGDDGNVILWTAGASAPRLARGLFSHTDDVRGVAYSNGLIASASSDTTVLVWNAETGEIVHRLAGHTETAVSVAFSPNGSVLASGGGDNSVRLWNMTTGEQIGEALTGPSNWVLSVAFSPDGLRVAAGGSDYNLWVWDVDSRELVLGPLAHENTVWAVAFSPDGRHIATASADYNVRIWDAASGELAYTLSPATDRIFTLAYSADGSLLAMGSGDKLVYLYETTEYAYQTYFEGHSDSVFSVAFSADGKMLASGGADNAIILWDIATGRAINQPLDRLSEWVNSMVFTENNKLVAGIGGPPNLFNPVLIYNLDTEAAITMACGIAGRNMTESEWFQYLGDSLYHETCPQIAQAQGQEMSIEALDAFITEIRGGIGNSTESAGRYMLAVRAVLQLNDSQRANSICWWGALDNVPELVMPACDHAIELDPIDGNAYDSRAVAQMLLGDTESAIEGIQYFLDWSDGLEGYERFRERRTRWLVEIAAGQNPIDEDELAELRAE